MTLYFDTTLWAFHLHEPAWYELVKYFENEILKPKCQISKTIIRGISLDEYIVTYWILYTRDKIYLEKVFEDLKDYFKSLNIETYHSQVYDNFSIKLNLKEHDNLLTLFKLIGKI